MMGQLPAQQNTLFYEFCLEKHIPEDHLPRQVDQFLDFDQARVHLDPFYSHTGRPSIDPELMIRMLLTGYCYGIPYCAKSQPTRITSNSGILKAGMVVDLSLALAP